MSNFETSRAIKLVTSGSLVFSAALALGVITTGLVIASALIHRQKDQISDL